MSHSWTTPIQTMAAWLLGLVMMYLNGWLISQLLIITNHHLAPSGTPYHAYLVLVDPG